MYQPEYEYQYIPTNKPAPAKRIGAVLVFRDGVDIERVQKYLDKLAEQDIIDKNASSKAVEYDPSWGSPVWYVP
jgi:hypothetical protein